MPSISTEIWLGNITLPTADRACRPASPKTSTNKSEQPLITFGESLKSGAALTMPRSYDEIDAVERAERIAHGRKQTQSDQPCAPVALLDTDIDAKLAGELLAIGVARTLAGEIENVTGQPVRQIIGDRSAKLRQHNTELFQTRFRSHDLILRNYNRTRKRAANSPTIPRRNASTQMTNTAP